MVYFEVAGTKNVGECHRRFNPCSNGWCTSRPHVRREKQCFFVVSILVLMDGVLRVPAGLCVREKRI